MLLHSYKNLWVSDSQNITKYAKMQKWLLEYGSAVWPYKFDRCGRGIWEQKAGQLLLLLWKGSITENDGNSTPGSIYPCLPQTFPFLLPMELTAGGNDKIQTCKCPTATSDHILAHQCLWTVLSPLTAAANQRQSSALDENPWSSLSRNQCSTLEK